MQTGLKGEPLLREATFASNLSNVSADLLADIHPDEQVRRMTIDLQTMSLN